MAEFVRKSNSIYVHYGAPQFDPNKFDPIQNWWNKPHGGLWASPIDANFGWKEWCRETNFRECTEENSFRFSLTSDANVYYIDCELAESHLPSLPWPCVHIRRPDLRIYDFEELLHAGVDAVELNLSAYRPLYWLMYGWDCDCILILNPDVIVPIGRECPPVRNSR